MIQGPVQTLERVYTGQPSHRLPNTLLSAALLSSIVKFSAGRQWTAVIMLANGEMIVRASPDLRETPDADRMHFAREYARRLNREIHHGGAWVVVWYDSEEWTALWKDSDGDVQFTLDCNESWARIKNVPISKFMSDAEMTWQKWHLVWFEQIGIRPEQTMKLAQGQRRLSS